MSATELLTAKSTYYKVFAALLVLLVATVAAAEVRHPLLGIVLAMTIVIAKAVLIVIYFMNLRHTSSLTRVFAVAGAFWLVVMLALLLSDYTTIRRARGWGRTKSQRDDTSSCSRLLLQTLRTICAQPLRGL